MNCYIHAQFSFSTVNADRLLVQHFVLFRGNQLLEQDSPAPLYSVKVTQENNQQNEEASDISNNKQPHQ